MSGSPLHGRPLKAYWVTVPGRVGLGYGVTGFDLSDALAILRKEGIGLPEGPDTFHVTEHVTEHVAFADLDAGHVVPNMGPMTLRGMWFPSRNL